MQKLRGKNKEMVNEADIFVLNQPKSTSYFYSFLKLFVFSYYQIIKSKRTFSRREIHEKAKNISGSKKINNPIEDYLRNVLVKEFVLKYQIDFLLNDFIIDCGIEETKEYITTGFLDIKIKSKNLMDNTYYIFECKRLNNGKIKYYINEGMYRFITRKYYPEIKIGYSGMIAFVEEKIKPNINHLSIQELVENLGNNISENTIKLNLSQNIQYFQLHHDNNEDIINFKHSYISKHKCNDQTKIDIHHLIFDYYNILLP